MPDQPGARPEFSLVEGGLFGPLVRRLSPAPDPTASAHRRMLVMALLAWLPLLALSAVEGHAAGTAVAVPFLKDVEVHIRFLVALPLLILAEVAVQQRVPPILREFLERHLVPEESIAAFRAAVDSSLRMRVSALAEILVIAFVYGVGVLVVWRHYWTLDAATWYAMPVAGGSTLTYAGLWYGFVSLPVVQFLLLRWYWRLFVWARLLWKISRIRLRLVPAHPDRVGGLEFLASTGHAFMMLAAAHGALAAGQIASRIFFAGATLPEFADAIALLVLLVLCLVLGPLFAFTPQLAAARRQGLRQYGSLAERYLREFEAKWLAGDAKPGEPLMGSADIQSLADMGNSYGVAQGMRIAPITRETVVGLAFATLAPVAPLLLTLVPLNELLKKLLGIEL